MCTRGPGGAGAITSELLDCEALVLDELSVSQLVQAGVAPGWRCWAAGAGNGSIASWLSYQVGPRGEVIATDRDTRPLRPAAGVCVLRHDVFADPPPDGRFDVIHARLLLGRSPGRRETLARLADALTARGVLLVEERGPAPGRVLASPDPDAGPLYDRYRHALREIEVNDGGDPDWGVAVPAAMAAAGLGDVETTVHARSWAGGSAGCRWAIALAHRQHAQLALAGMPPADLARLCELLGDPRLVLLGDPVYATLGRR